MVTMNNAQSLRKLTICSEQAVNEQHAGVLPGVEGIADVLMTDHQHVAVGVQLKHLTRQINRNNTCQMTHNITQDITQKQHTR